MEPLLFYYHVSSFSNGKIFPFQDGVLIYQVFEKSTPSLQEQQDLVNQLKPYFGDGTSTEMIEENPLERYVGHCYVPLLF